ncbi:hypothetical protein Acr_22g0004710 [Actinidia rufa]|uniref:Reverse transcriptase domain-containing protein n=1 Tax=Actinidia rufa TaxID=165716 RepID=A0A7J0GJU4_9ERIC|nr:hypothetical protein Acr_22g0004710 [Actinidia rufa]
MARERSEHWVLSHPCSRFNQWARAPKATTVKTPAPNSANKFSVLDRIPETEEEPIQILGPESTSAQVQEISSDQAQVANKQQKIQLGRNVYFEQAKQIASEDLNLKLRKLQRLRLGPQQLNIKRNQPRLAGNLVLGFNKPLKQNGVLEHIRKNKVVVMGILESKLKQQKMKDIVRKKFSSWLSTSSNFLTYLLELLLQKKIYFQVQQQLHDNPRDASLQNKVATLKVKSFRLAEGERSFCSQLAKAKYLKNCDKGTKFFHELIKNNRARRQIVALTKEDGPAPLLSSREVLVEGKIVEEEHALSLIQPVSDDEVKSALFSIGDDKAPRPNGYSSCLFKSAWSIVGSDVCAAVKEFFVSGKLLKQLNHAVIALVSKSTSASRVEEFRNIACCNVIYKVISKILATGLSPILESLIDPGQSVFVPNRSMVENIYVVQELLRKYCWSRISPRCIMKVDLRKAYDTVNWVFLEDVLSEYLSRKLGRLKSNPDFNFHPKCAALNICHLAFADDLILFTRGDVISVSLIMDCLKKFGECSGLHISDTKSNVFMADISREIMEEIKTITISSGRFPFRYLGIPLVASRLTIEQFNPLIFKISEYITAWASVTLSYAGRSELIRSVLQGVELVFKKSLVAWREICRPKSGGGLGFIDLHAWNLALISKSLWNLQSKKDSLWAVAKKVGFACTVYFIWATRNARIFEGKITHPTGVIRDIQIQVYRVLHASFRTCESCDGAVFLLLICVIFSQLK